MSRVIRREQCPRCKKQGRDVHKDNLGVYDDNHKFCFRCRLYIPSNSTLSEIMSDKKRLYLQNDFASDVCLPEDCEMNFPRAAQDWMRSYHIATPEWLEWDIQYSEKEKQIIFPIFNPPPFCGGTGPEEIDPNQDQEPREMIAYMARNLDSSKSKWYLVGNMGSRLDFRAGMYFRPSDTVILVEDVLSAIKIASIANAIPLFGVTCAPMAVQRLAKKFKNIVIWLDADAFDRALRISRDVDVYGIGAKSYLIKTQADPKCYNNRELYNILQYTIQKEEM